MRIHRDRRARNARGTTIGPRHRARTGALAPSNGLGSERGDVPGWVMITLMTAAIVVALWAVASDQIVQIFESAMAPFLNKNL